MKNFKVPAIRLLLLIQIITLSACAAVNQAVSTEAPTEAPVLSEMSVTDANSLTLTTTEDSQLIYILPPYITDGGMSLEQALTNRRSRRDFQNKPITTSQLSQILWAAYGITLPIPNAPNLRGGLRTTPSAGALYPLEIYVIIGNVIGLEPGVYRYISEEHKLIRTVNRDVRYELSQAALGQRMVREAPATVFYSAVFSRMTGRYGERGIKYAYIELGHSAQNIYLQAESLGLGTVAIGAFDDNRVREILLLPPDEEPLYLMPIGYYYD